MWLSIIASCTFYAVGDVMFASAGSRVDEGDGTSGVCLELNGTASALGFELDVNLTTVTGKAGIFYVMNVKIADWPETLSAFHTSDHCSVCLVFKA